MHNTALALKDAPPREYANALAAGTMLMEYRLERVLGAGGFGITYLAWDPQLEKHVAIKEYLPAQLAVRALDGSVVPIATEQQHDYAWGLGRFVQEARTLARFCHSHIVRVIRYIEANGTAYMAMEYAEGQSLSQWLAGNPRPGQAQLCKILLPLLDGLDAIHAQGFLHRDIKPANIFMRDDDNPLLLDFGAARQAVGRKSMSLTSIVSPGYAPLEQYASDGNQGPWTDVYSLSAVLFRAVTGQNPPEAVSRVRIDRVSQHLERVKNRYSEAFLKAIAGAMALDEKMRPQSVAEWRPLILGDAQAPPSAGLETMPRSKSAATAREAGANAARQSPLPATVVADDSVRAQRRSRWVVVGMLAAGLIALLFRGSPTSTLPPVPAAHVPSGSAPVTSLSTPLQANAFEVQPPVRQPASSEIERLAPPGRAPNAVSSGPRLALSGAQGAAQDARAVPPHPKPPLHAKLPKPHPEMIRDFRLADSNADGALSPVEAQARLPRLAYEFERADANGDGRITHVEFQRFMQHKPSPAPRPQ